MGFGLVLGGVADGFRKQREDQRQQDNQDFENDQHNRLKKAQSAPAPRPGDLIPDDNTGSLSSDEVAAKLGVNADEWAHVQTQGVDAVNAYLKGHQAAAGATPPTPAPVAPSIAPVVAAGLPLSPAPAPAPAAAAAPLPAAPAAAIPAGAAAASAAPAAADPSQPGGQYVAYKTASGVRYTNALRPATVEDQMFARAQAYMANGLEDKAIPLYQFAVQNKMAALQLDQAQNAANYDKLWAQASGAAMSQNWGKVEDVANKMFAKTGSTIKVEPATDKTGLIKVDTIDNHTHHVTGSSYFSTDPNNPVNGQPDFLSFVASMKDPASRLAFAQQMSQSSYQARMATVAETNASTEKGKAEEDKRYHNISAGLDAQRIAVERQRAGTEAQSVTNQGSLIRSEVEKNNLMNGALRDIHTAPTGSDAWVKATNFIRTATGQPPLAATVGNPLIAGSRITNTNGTVDIVMAVGKGKDAVVMPIPQELAGAHGILTDPYVAEHKIMMGHGFDEKGNPIPVLIPMGASQGIPYNAPNAVAKAKAAYDMAHPAPKAIRPGAPAPASGTYVNPLTKGVVDGVTGLPSGLGKSAAQAAFGG